MNEKESFRCWVDLGGPGPGSSCRSDYPPPQWWICRDGEDTVPEILPEPGMRPFSSFEALELEFAVMGWERASGWQARQFGEPDEEWTCRVRRLGRA